MKEQLPNDPLASFFQKTLEQESTVSSTWDVPSDNVWKGVEAAIEEGSKRRLPVWWRWMAAASVLVFLSSAFCIWFLSGENTEYQVVEQTNKIAPLQQRTPENAETEPDITIPIQNDINIPEKKNPIIKQPSISPNSKAPNKINSTPKNLPTLTKQDPIFITKNEKEPSFKVNKEINDINQPFSWNNSQTTNDSFKANVIPSTTAPINKQKLEQSIVENIDNLIIEKLPAHTPKKIEGDWSQKTNLSDAAHQLQSIKIPTKRTNWYVGARYSPTYNFRTIKSKSKPDRNRFKKQEQFKLSSTFALNTGYSFISNWSVETGVGYHKAKLTSYHDAKIKYTSQDETLNTDGKLEGNYKTSLETSYGDIDTDLTVLRSQNSGITEGEELILRFVTTQQLQTLQVPLFLKYRIGNNKVKGTFKAGFSGNILVYKDISFKEFSSRDNRIELDNSKVSKKSNSGKWSFSNLDLVLGAGAEVALTPRLSMVVEPTFSKSITPIFNKKDFKTYPLTASLNLGLNYNF